MNTAAASETSTTYVASAPTADSPMRATSGSASANTPIGATTSSHRTRTSIASAMARKNTTTRSRCSARTEPRARPSTRAKTISGSIAPSAAARKGFDGTSATSHSPGDCIALALAASDVPAGAALARRLATADALTLMRATTGGATSAPRMPDAASRMMKSATPRAPMRAMAPPPPDVAMPTIRLDTTSGMTVIRIALTNSVPIGSTTEATRRERSGSTSLSASPMPTPAARAMRTRVVSDTPQSYARSDAGGSMRWRRSGRTTKRARRRVRPALSSACGTDQRFELPELRSLSFQSFPSFQNFQSSRAPELPEPSVLPGFPKLPLAVVPVCSCHYPVGRPGSASRSFRRDRDPMNCRRDPSNSNRDRCSRTADPIAARTAITARSRIFARASGIARPRAAAARRAAHAVTLIVLAIRHSVFLRKHRECPAPCFPNYPAGSAAYTQHAQCQVFVSASINIELTTRVQCAYVRRDESASAPATGLTRRSRRARRPASR